MYDGWFMDYSPEPCLQLGVANQDQAIRNSMIVGMTGHGPPICVPNRQLIVGNGDEQQER